MTEETKDPEVEEVPEVEDRIDDNGYAVSIFESMGYKGRLPDTLVKIYLAFKKRKDRVLPGRLTPEGFALVLLLADMTDGKEEFSEE